ncbi:hypothetical protein O0I10_006690 [Lichtheimia ornata]|uniref:Reverse transcriptase domain-containing protein n=1 Tax=Lichtheimia ornata TaxID=688661 RepID=A0AAD7V2H7_9FUNG|nr:uncharacterized protein O0I10_006690 [Lichtheimia ornata]KAJ8657625.1 hypothetical protein O0I10_006690 [Lichtheimia ornata]
MACRPIWLRNSPALFQSTMNRVLNDYLDDFVMVYLDDILIYGKSKEEHEVHVRKVLQRLRDEQLIANLKKCDFYKTESWLYQVSAGGYKPSRTKVKHPRLANTNQCTQRSVKRRLMRLSRIMQAPILASPDPLKPFIIETDASDYGVGAVLLQKADDGTTHPIAFESKKLSKEERGYPAQEPEGSVVRYVLT